MTPDEVYQEALRRIEDAARTGAVALDLGDLPLDRLPDELGKLSALRVLSLGGNSVVPEADGWLDLKIDGSRLNPTFRDITVLEPLSRLTHLSLAGCEGVRDVAPLAGLASLQDLNLRSTGVRDVAPLADLAEVTLRFEFLHEGVLRSMLSKIGSEVGDVANYWKYGCLFFEGQTGSKLLMTGGWDNADDEWGPGSVRLRAWGGDTGKLLSRVVALFENLPLAQKPQVTWGDGSPEPPADEPSLVAARPEVTGPTVYVSYAWGDDSPAGQVRRTAVERLVARLEAEGVTVGLDKQMLKHGDKITEFMKLIGTSPRVLVILSEKYLFSKFCMTEINHVFDHSLWDVDDFMQRVEPVVLPDADRFVYGGCEPVQNYWDDESEKLAPRAGRWRLSPRQYAEGQRIDGWAKSIPNILGEVADRVRTRSLEGDDDIEAVVARLTRPLGA